LAEHHHSVVVAALSTMRAMFVMLPVEMVHPPRAAGALA
jgi:hypothetical protein